MKFDIMALLNKSGFENISTPSLLPIESYLPYVNPNNHNQIVKLIAPDGTVKALRYDSTIAALCSSSPVMEEKFYYDEPKYAYDFDKKTIEEEEQLGIEIIGETGKIDTLIDITLDIALLMTEGKFHIDLGNTNIPKLLIENYKSLKPYEMELYQAISRKNKKYTLSILEDAGADEETIRQFIDLLELNGPFKSILEKFEILHFPETIRNEFMSLKKIYENIPSKFGKHVYCDLSFSDRLKYYDGFVFKVYNTKTHKEIISGGSYHFPVQKVKGIGFSIRV